jgi:predicted ArsR family transcriptional regulator
MNAKIIELWDDARRPPGGRVIYQRATPPAGYCSLLVGLLDGPVHGHELCRRTGVNQANSVVYLRRMKTLGLVTKHDVPGLGHQGGGRPAYVWELTHPGRELARVIKEAA